MGFVCWLVGLFVCFVFGAAGLFVCRAHCCGWKVPGLSVDGLRVHLLFDSRFLFPWICCVQKCFLFSSCEEDTVRGVWS